MDFLSRADQNPQPVRPVPSSESVVTPTLTGKPSRPQKTKKDWFVLGSHIATNVLLFGVALLVAAVVWLICTTQPPTQSKYVDPSKLQAVFLNSGQVYFGNIQTLNKDYLILTNVFYLQTADS